MRNGKIRYPKTEAKIQVIFHEVKHLENRHISLRILFFSTEYSIIYLREVDVKLDLIGKRRVFQNMRWVVRKDGPYLRTPTRPLGKLQKRKLHSEGLIFRNDRIQKKWRITVGPFKPKW